MTPTTKHPPRGAPVTSALRPAPSFNRDPTGSAGTGLDRRSSRRALPVGARRTSLECHAVAFGLPVNEDARTVRASCRRRL
jgi:hypothetical protein